MERANHSGLTRTRLDPVVPQDTGPWLPKTKGGQPQSP